VIQKLLPFFLTAQESVTLVKFPGRNKYVAFLLKKHHVSQKAFESLNTKRRAGLRRRYEKRDSPANTSC